MSWIRTLTDRFLVSEPQKGPPRMPIDDLLATARIPKRFQRYRLDTHPDRAAVTRLDDWDYKKNIIIGGDTGRGKTGLAIGLARKLLEDDVRGVEYVSVPEMLDDMRPGSGGDDPMSRLKRRHVLILDDLGSAKPSDWVYERLYVLINARYESELPTIVTTNIQPESLVEAIGDRVVSRLQEDAITLAVTGPDRRIA